MDAVEGMRQIVTLAVPPVEELGPPDVTVELARGANDEMGSSSPLTRTGSPGSLRGCP